VNTGWFEVWADDSHDVPYILVLIGGDGTFRIFDPREGNKLCFESNDYDTATSWLCEDEFELVGRKNIEPNSYWEDVVKAAK
jgi:hypothetical protein